MNYKNYRRLFESVKPKSKKFFLLQTINPIPRRCKTTWRSMKEVIGKAKLLLAT